MSKSVHEFYQLTPEEKARKLKEYGVKEGEIFIDKNLVNRRY
jgi:hypothetical protein